MRARTKKAGSSRSFFDIHYSLPRLVSLIESRPTKQLCNECRTSSRGKCLQKATTEIAFLLRATLALIRPTTTTPAVVIVHILYLHAAVCMYSLPVTHLGRSVFRCYVCVCAHFLQQMAQKLAPGDNDERLGRNYQTFLCN